MGDNTDMDDFDLLWCIECQCCHGPECPSLGVQPSVSDTPIQSKAFATLPSTLRMLVNDDGMRRVVAREAISCRTQFGPVDAPIQGSGDEIEEMSPSRLFLKIFNKDGSSVHLNQTDENQCNWMCLVQPATCTNHQNLIAYQYKSALYYSATQDIAKDVELRVWYAPHYAPRMGKSLLSAVTESDADDDDDGVGLTMDMNDGDDDDDPRHASSTDIPRQIDQETMASLSSCDAPKSKDDLIQSKICARAESSHNKKSKSSRITETREKNQGNEVDRIRTSDIQIARNLRSKRTRSAISKGKNSLETEATKTKINTKHAIIQNKRFCKTQPHKTSRVDQPTNLCNITENNSPCPICRELHPQETFAEHMKDHKAAISSVKPGTHMAAISKKPDKKIFKCGLCDSSFCKSGDLENHFAKSHCKDRKELSEKVLESVTIKRRKNLDTVCPQENNPSSHGRSDYAKRQLLSPQTDDSSLQSEPHRVTRSKRTGRTPQKLKQSPRTFFCKKCDKDFESSQLARNHCNKVKTEQISQDSNKYACKKCSMQCETMRLAKKHCKSKQITEKSTKIVTNHKPNGLKGKKMDKSRKKKKQSRDYKCTECTEIFFNEILYRKHLLKDHNIRLFTCEYCPRTFARKSSQLNHYLTHLKAVTSSDGKKAVFVITNVTSEDSLFKCKECSCEFKKWESYKKHMDGIHKDVSVWYCDVCCTTYDGHKELEAHMEEHESMELPEGCGYHECDVCHSLFLNPFKLKRHKDQYDNRRDHVCEICGKGFGRPDTLMRHKQNHNKRQPSTVCTVCGVTFKNASSVTLHMKLHEKDSSFVCSQCDRSFTQLGNYNKHLLTHAQVKTYKCLVCNKGFNHAQSLKRHSYRHMDKANKMHKCDYCGSQFYEKHALVRHQQDLHLNKRSCICELCGLFIKRLESYYRHMRRKHPHVAATEYKPLKVTKDYKDLRKRADQDKAPEELTAQTVDAVNKENDSVMEVIEDSSNDMQIMEENENKLEAENNQPEVMSKVKGHEASDSFAEDGELIKALTKLKQTISDKEVGDKPSPSKASESLFPVTLYKDNNDEVMLQDCGRDGENENESSPELYLVVESNDNHLQDGNILVGSEVMEGQILGSKVEGSEIELETEQPENLEMENVIVESEPQVVDSDILIMKIASVDSLITHITPQQTLNATPADTKNPTAGLGGQIVPETREESSEVTSTQALTSRMDHLTASVSPGPMLGNQSLISMPNEMITKQFTVPSVPKSEESLSVPPKSTPVNSFISIESLLALPSSSSSSSASVPDQTSSSLVTQGIVNWQQSSTNHSLVHGSLGNNSLGNSNQGSSVAPHFIQGIKFSSPAAQKQTTNFSNVNSLAMPSSSSGIQRNIKTQMLEPHQHVGQGISLTHQPAGQNIALTHQSVTHQPVTHQSVSRQSVTHQPAGQTLSVMHQPAGQTVDLSFLNKPSTSGSSLINLQQSSVGMQHFVPIASPLEQNTTATCFINPANQPNTTSTSTSNMPVKIFFT